jgi:hypothetical protein
MKSSLFSLIPFLLFRLNQLRLPSQETPSILILQIFDPLYTAYGRIQQKTPFHNNSFFVIEVCLPHCCVETAVLLCCLRVHFRRNLFTKSLPNNERLLWLPYFGFQTSCHSIKILFDSNLLGLVEITSLHCGGSVSSAIGHLLQLAYRIQTYSYSLTLINTTILAKG